MDEPTTQDYLDASTILPNPRGIASTNAEENPDVAAQSVALSKQTGIPAPVIHADPDRFAEQLKAQTAGDIVAGNSQLQRYVTSDPMAAKVSSDDWDKLDAASQATSKLSNPSIFQAMGKGWAEGWDYQGQQDALNEIVNAYDSPAWRAFATHVLGLGRAAFDIPAHAISGVVQSGVAGLTQAFANAGDTDLYHSIFGEMASGAPERLGRDLNVLAQTLMMEGHGLGATKEAQAGAALDQKYTAPPLTIHPHVQAFLDLADKIKPFVQDGKDVPVGVHQITDQVKADEADTGADALKEATKAAQASATRERSPEMFRDFAAQHVGEETFGVSADAVLKLYGNNIPEAGKGPLGFVSDLPMQLQRAAITGEDIKVPKADWLAHIEPDVAEQLYPDTRLTPDGLTQNEAKNLPKQERNYEPTEGPERVVASTFTVDGKVYTAPSHVDAMQKAADELTGGDVDEMLIKHLGFTTPETKVAAADGFLTSTGRVVNRQEAADIAQAQQQGDVIPKFARSEDIGIRDPISQTVDTLRQASGLKVLDIPGGKAASDTIRYYHGAKEGAEPTTYKAWITPHQDYARNFRAGETPNNIYYVDIPKDNPELMKQGHDEINDIYQHFEASEELSKRLKPLDIPGGKAKETPAQTIKPSAVGINADQAARYQKLIAAQQSADTEAALRRAEAFERRQQTPEWKTNEKEMRGEVTAEITQQPRFMADQAIRNGDIGKLDVDSLTDEQRAGLPSSYYKRGGESPDWVARVLGYSSGDDLITDLSALKAARGDMKPGDYLKSLIDSETSRRMEEKYGKLEENIIQTAKEQVLTETQLDLLHADLEQLSGGKLNFTKDQLRQNAAEAIGNTKLSAISSDSYLASAGRAGRAAEDALLKGDPSEAFRQRQRQYTSTMYAKEAMKVEKAKAQFDKLAKKYQKRDIKGRAPEYVNQIQDLLIRLGQGVKRSVQNIQEAILKDATGSLEDFTRQSANYGRDLFTPDFLFDQNFRKSVNDLTGSEFMAVQKSLKAMDFHARDELKVIKGGEKADKAEVKAELFAGLEALGEPKKYGPDREVELTSNKEQLKSFWWQHIIPETMFNRIDKGDPFGPFNQVFTRVYTEAANLKERETKALAAKLTPIMKGFGDLSKKVSNDLWIDPMSGTTLDLTREHLFGILQNIGNASNRKKLFEGYKVPQEAGLQWIWDALRKDGKPEEALQRASAIGKLFNELFDKADNMSRNINGVGIDKLPLGKLETPFGTFDEWYHPAAEDTLRSEYGARRSEKALFEQGSYRATTPQGYTKARTGIVYPINIGMGIVPARMSQMVHDIYMRPAVVQLSKFFYDKDFRQKVKQYYGDHQAEALIPFLRDMANSPNYQSQAEQMNNQWISHYTSNMVSTLVGGNIGTIAKHGTTAAIKSLASMPIGFTRELLSLGAKDPVSGLTNLELARTKSDEVARRHDNFTEMANRQGAQIAPYRGGIAGTMGSLRTLAQHIGSAPIAFFDMLSAAPAFLATYKRAIADGMDEGAAIFLGNRYVRRTHGSSIFTNKAEISRSKNGLVQTYATLYNFFSENLNIQYETAWRMKDAYNLARESSMAEATKKVPAIAGTIFTALLVPGIVDYVMTSHKDGAKKPTWPEAALDVLGGTASAGFFGVRDLVHGLLTGQDAQGGLLPQMFKSLSDPIKDLASHKAFTPATTGAFLKHFIIMLGLTTGITNEAEGNATQFAYNYFHNREHPQGPWQILEGLRYGKTKGHSKSFEDWLQHEVPK